MEWSGERNGTQRRISDICIVAGEQGHLETSYWSEEKSSHVHIVPSYLECYIIPLKIEMAKKDL